MHIIHKSVHTSQCSNSRSKQSKKLIEAGFVYYTFEQEFIVVRNENNCRQCIID